MLPFDVLMFKSHRAVAPSSRRGLEVLELCARRLLQELRLESYAPGLEVEVQVLASTPVRASLNGLHRGKEGCSAASQS